MMLEELGLVVDDSNYVLNGFVNFFSFVILGFIPLIPYFVGYYGYKDN
jgi:VIT1/CCC1 family predicted Fe2+/Mn2+ transporter